MSGLSLVELLKRFPDEQAATERVESERWPDGDHFCPHCGCFGGVCDIPNAKPMP